MFKIQDQSERRSFLQKPGTCMAIICFAAIGLGGSPASATSAVQTVGSPAVSSSDDNGLDDSSDDSTDDSTDDSSDDNGVDDSTDENCANGDGVYDSSDDCFEDVSRSHRFHGEIEWMKRSGLSNGYSDGSYHPLENLSRQAMAAFLYRQAGKPVFTMPAVLFTDVPATHKFFTEIMWMKASGLSTGFEDGSFHPSESLSRAAMAAFMYRNAGEPPVIVNHRFRDVAQDYRFYREIEWMGAEGISKGNADGTYHPGATVTREVMAAFLYRQHH